MGHAAAAAIESLETAISQVDDKTFLALPTTQISAAMKMIVSSSEIQMAALDAQNWCTGLVRSLGDPDVSSRPDVVEVARRTAGNAVRRLRLLVAEAEERKPSDLQ